VTISQNEVDPWGRVIVDPERVFDLLYLGAKPNEIVCETTPGIEHYNRLCIQWDKANEAISSLAPPDTDPDQDRLARITDWKLPSEFAEINVRKHILTLCKRDDERRRVNEEMDMFEERGLNALLQLTMALVDHFRKNNVVWGVGRGSSVSSYCLYLIGLHKIDAIKYKLDIKEFLR
jgi:DNA polymerase III alpha subunit